MFKLLTDNARIKAKKEYSLRKLIVGLGGVCIIFLIGDIALLPSHIISQSRMSEAQTRISALKNQSSTQDAHTLVEWLDEFNKQISSLTPIEGNNSPYKLFVEIINTKPSGISINGLVMRKDSKSTTLSISGVAKGRKDLYDFENTLNNSGNFSEVVIPVSNFAKNSDIDFQFNLSPK
ncbi:MAG: PilN domain-containing protein [Minisyncoccia bacterium]